jgi:3,2-trans-enoyl-CoA isomerase
MKFVSVSQEVGIATVILNRGKVNALNETLVEQIRSCFVKLENDKSIKAIIFTAQGKFFSFGFDIPEFLSYPKGSFIKYLTKFTNLYTSLFLFPKPIVAVLNGHAIAGGCMLALACDSRIMVSGKAKISLNEISFGSSVFAGSVEMLKFCVGQKNAESVLYSGAMYSAEEAIHLGLIDQISLSENLMDDARKAAQDFVAKGTSAFRAIKGLLRKPVAEEMVKREKDSIREFVDIWYSEETWKNLEKIKIHS